MKLFKKIAAYLLLVITLTIFVYYLHAHSTIIDSLKKLSLLDIAGLVSLYIVSIFILVLILKYSVEICGKSIDSKDNILLTAYSTIVNFFGPLQSGPGVRAIYLKRKYQITIKRFLGASLLYYIFFAIISGFIAVAGSSYWHWLFVYVLAAAIAYIFVRKLSIKRLKTSKNGITLKESTVIKLAAVTFLQVILVSAIYFFELHIVNSKIGYHQALTYTGFANFALFVSLTPGAIGIRESFLVLSRHFHHISTSNILAASVIDRGIYLIFLAILLLIIVVFKIKDKLNVTESDQLSADNDQ